MRDLANLNLSVGLGILGGKVGTREGVAATGSFREVRRTVVEGQKIGYEKCVLDHDQASAREKEEEELRKLEASLTAQLDAVRERRGA